MTQTGRQARIVSLSFSPRRLTEIAAVVDQEGARGADLIVLPETWQGQGDSPETLAGPTIATFAELARRHSTYIVCPLDRIEGRRRVNSAVALDRAGHVVCVYDKVYPYWSEYGLRTPVQPGWDVPVFAADFGRVGMAICFDVNFAEVWRCLADAEADLVVWPSAYSAGTTLQAHALVHHYYIVTATWTGDCLVYDMTGECLLDERSADLNISRITLDLDRGIYHENFNMAKRDRLLAERGAEVSQEKHLPREQWFVLRAARPGVSARALAQEYGLEELRAYIDRSRRCIDEMRQREAKPAMSMAGQA